LTEAETTISGIDGAAITQTVRDQRFLFDATEQNAENLLASLMYANAEFNEPTGAVAAAVQTLSSKVDEDMASEAAMRLQLQANTEGSLHDANAAIEAETVARTTISEAFAADRLQLEAAFAESVSQALQFTTLVADSTSASAEALNVLRAEAKDSSARTVEWTRAIATGSEALAERIEELSTNVEGNRALVQDAVLAAASTTSAVAQRVEIIKDHFLRYSKLLCKITKCYSLMSQKKRDEIEKTCSLFYGGRRFLNHGHSLLLEGHESSLALKNSVPRPRHHLGAKE
jgi:hypothetical protein